MRKYIKYIVAVIIGLSMQGCISHNVEKVSLDGIEDSRQLMMATQSFECQNAFFGAAHVFIVNKNDIYKRYTLPEGTEVSAFGELSGGVVDKRAIFLKHKELMGRDMGFLVFPDGSFVYDRAEQQLGILDAYGASGEFMFNIPCDFKGEKAFRPLNDEEFESIKSKLYK